MSFKHLVLASAAAMVASGASAVINDWGVHDDLEIGAQTATFIGGGGMIMDWYTFSLADSAEVTGIATVGTPGLHGLVELYEGTPDALGAEVDTEFGLPGFGSFKVGPGTYSYKVSAPVDGPGDYSYQLNSIAVVPEPETYALMLAGLGAVGFVARRRNSRV